MTDNQEASSPEQKLPSAGSSVPVLPDHFLPPTMILVPVQNAVVFPSLMAPILISEPRFVASIEQAIQETKIVGILLSREKEPHAEMQLEELYSVGVVCKILKRLKMPDGSVNILVHSLKRFRISEVISQRPYLVAKPEYLSDELDSKIEMDALTRMVVDRVRNLSELNPFFTDEMRLAMLNAPGPGTVADLVAFALSLPKKEAQIILETLSVKARLEKILVLLQQEQDVAELQAKIQDDVNSRLNKMQREFFLKEQLKVIRKELGHDGETGKEGRSFKERIEAAGMSPEAKKIAFEELEKLDHISEQSPEHHIVRNYLETLCSLPWSNETPDNLDLARARTILDEDHFGLEKIKERILEFLAVRSLVAGTDPKKPKGSILCLVGPPGVGKTSVAKSIARTLGRKFFRFSLGGMRDEAEIKGHRRTYIGAMPGKIIQGLRRAESKNPVLVLDEIDKLGKSFQGDPASALLEVLDPEQNQHFLDHYLDVSFDLSNVLFVATANDLNSIPEPLLDRMEVIELPGYTLEEKEKIATKYVIPKVLEKHGLRANQLRVDRTALKALMRNYARESGLRSLEKMIEKMARRAAKLIVEQGLIKRKNQKPIMVEADDLKEWLGPKRFYNELAERITAPGVVVGLAWTATGGDILFIEARKVPGTGQLKLTGKMGAVMTESANIAWSYIKSLFAEEQGWKHDHFKDFDVHLHIPAGAVPKDGPSAGVTMATALYSLLSGTIMKHGIAMTGELSLIGKVLPVGGIQEKILAAKRSGITTVLLPKLNAKDLDEVPPYALEGMKIEFIGQIDEILAKVLGRGSKQRPVIPRGNRTPIKKVQKRRMEKKKSDRIQPH